MLAYSILLSSIVTVSLSGMAVGMGAMWPQFHLDNPTRIASSLGGVLFMLSGCAYLVVICIASAPPLYALRYYVTQDLPPTGSRLWWVVGSIAVLLLVSSLINRIPLKLGSKRLN